MYRHIQQAILRRDSFCQRIGRALLCGGLILACGTVARSQEIQLSVANGLYSNGGIWVGGGVPTSANRVVFDRGTGSNSSIGFSNGVNESDGFSVRSGMVVLDAIHAGAHYDAVVGSGSSVTGNSQLEINGNSIGFTVTTGPLSILEGSSLSLRQGAILNIQPGFDQFGGTAPNLTVGDEFSAGNLAIDGATLTVSEWSNISVHRVSAGSQLSVSNNGLASFADFSSLEIAGQVQVNSDASLLVGQMLVTGSGSITGQNSLLRSQESLSIHSSGNLAINNGASAELIGTLLIGEDGQLEIGVAGPQFSLVTVDDNVTVNAGTLIVGPNGELEINPNRTLLVQNGGNVTYQASHTLKRNMVVTGLGSELNNSNSSLRIASTLNIADGATADIANSLFVGDQNEGPGRITISNQGTLIANNVEVGGHGQDSLQFDGGIADIDAAIVIQSQTNGGSPFVEISNGSQVQTGALHIGTSDAINSVARLSISQSSVVVDGSGLLNIGSSGNTGGRLEISSGSITASTTNLKATGSIHMTGGDVELGNLSQLGGTINFLGGYLAFTGDAVVESGGLFDKDVLELGSEHELAIDGDLEIATTAAMLVSGSVVEATNLNVGGQLDVNVGSLQIENDLVIGNSLGPSPALVRIGLTGPTLVSVGNNALVGESSQLQVSGGLLTAASVNIEGTMSFQGGATLANNLIVNSTGSLIVSGGSVTTANDLNNSGNLTLTGGAITSQGTLGNQSGALIHLSNTGSLRVTSSLTNDGDLLLDGPAATVSGGPLQNGGLIRGTGKILNNVTNSSSGEVRAENGKTLQLQGANGTNAGRLNLQGGTLEFSQPIKNGPTGQIIGRGSLFAHGGLSNSGQMHFSGGFTDVHGDVANNSGGEIILSGGSVTTLFDDLTHNGNTIRLRDNTTLVIFGHLSGAGGFSGNGLLAIEGTMSPGNSPALVNMEIDYSLGSSAELVMELGGRQIGAEYDSLNITGAAELAGQLNVQLLNGFVPTAGDQFTLLLASEGITGTFDQLLLPTLDPSLGWNLSYAAQSVTLNVQVVPEPAAWLLAAFALIGLLAIAGRNRRAG